MYIRILGNGWWDSDRQIPPVKQSQARYDLIWLIW